MVAAEQEEIARQKQTGSRDATVSYIAAPSSVRPSYLIAVAVRSAAARCGAGLASLRLPRVALEPKVEGGLLWRTAAPRWSPRPSVERLGRFTGKMLDLRREKCLTCRIGAILRFRGGFVGRLQVAWWVCGRTLATRGPLGWKGKALLTWREAQESSLNSDTAVLGRKAPAHQSHWAPLRGPKHLNSGRFHLTGHFRK